MRIPTTAIAAGLTMREAPVAGAALLAFLLVVALWHQDGRLQPGPADRPAAPAPAASQPAAPAGEPIVLEAPPPLAPAATPAPAPAERRAPPAAAGEAPSAATPEPMAAPSPATAGPTTDAQAAAAPLDIEPPMPRPVPEPAAATTVALRPGDSMQRRGRVLLQLLESGSGPNVVIAWPSAEAERERLAAVLARCYGMELGLLRRDNSVLRADDPPGVAQPIDFDRWSRFPRAPSGVVTAFERAIEADLRRHHRGASGLFDSRPVRLFPRAIDAALLGGLETLLGEHYADSQDIQLGYQLDDGEVRLTDLRRDGVPVPGALTLPKLGRCSG